jgi:hypothetical protein
MYKKRKSNMEGKELLDWIKNEYLEYPPTDWEKDCWISNPSAVGVSYVKGRPLIYYKKKPTLLYRATWELWHEKDFPKGFHASHICEVKNCVNPLHIVPETPSENELRKTNIKRGTSVLKVTPSELTLEEKVDWWLTHHTQKTADGCLEFLGSIGEDGYGKRNIRIDGAKKKIAVHRLVCSLKEERDYNDSSWVARHVCNNRKCINPEHLVAGTRSENTIDSRSYSKATKITEEQAREIIEDYLTVAEWPHGSKVKFCRKWAEALEVGVDVINNMVFRRIRWKDLLKEYGL